MNFLKKLSTWNFRAYNEKYFYVFWRMWFRENLFTSFEVSELSAALKLIFRYFLVSPLYILYKPYGQFCVNLILKWTHRLNSPCVQKMNLKPL